MELCSTHAPAGGGGGGGHMQFLLRLRCQLAALSDEHSMLGACLHGEGTCNSCSGRGPQGAGAEEYATLQINKQVSVLKTVSRDAHDTCRWGRARGMLTAGGGGEGECEQGASWKLQIKSTAGSHGEGRCSSFGERGQQ